MNKKHLHRVWRQLKPFNSWLFLGLALLFLVVGTFAIRQNNLKSIQLRDELLAADEANGDVETALNKLREHIYSHMNANLSSGSLQQPIQLKYRYERLVEAQQQANAGSNDIYAQATSYCEALFPAGSLREGRVPCIEQYLAQHGGVQTQASDIPDSLYKFDFVSPRWSPDLAGWSLLLSGVFFGLFLIRFLLERWMKAELSQHL